MVNIPTLSKKSEEFAVGKLVEAINGHCMSQAYVKLQHSSSTSHVMFSYEDLSRVFDIYLERIWKGESSLAEVISRFTSSFNWPMPDEHFRRSY